MRSVVAIVIAVLGGAVAGAQAPPRDQPRVAATGSAIVTGAVIVDDDTRGPLRRATVTLSRSGVEDVRTTTSDDQGRYVFDHLPAGSYALGAAKGAYIPKNYGAPKPGMSGGTIVVSEGQTFAARPIALMRGAVIAGRLLDRSGRPVSGTIVTANRFMMVNGERRRRSTEGSERDSTTNAHGEYRIYGLLPGEYLVYAGTPGGTETVVTAEELKWGSQPSGPAPRPGPPAAYAPTIFPGTADAAAAVVIALVRGEERLGVDFSLRHVLASRVTGTVTGPDGKPAPNVTVRFSLRQPNQFTLNAVTSARAGPDGGFTFTGVPPGEYVLAARGGVPGSPADAALFNVGLAPPPLWGMVDVVVAGQDLSDIAIRLQPGAVVSGQAVLSPTSSPASADLKRFQVQLVPTSGALPITARASAPVSAEGVFRIEGVVPGPYRVTATAPGGWFLRSVLLGDKDVADATLDVAPGPGLSGLVVTFVDVQSELSGVLTDRDARPAPQLHVFVFPADKAMWLSESRRIRSVRSGENGTYALAGLPPGEYYLCALTELETMLQFEPEYLEQLVPSSIKITLGEGEKKKQDLRIGGVPAVVPHL